MANELRMSSVAGVGANDTDDFVLAAYDESGVLQLTALRVPVAGYQTVKPAAADGVGTKILPGIVNVLVDTNTTDVNDWITLPAVASVPIGHTITVVGNTAGCEVRTPATSNEKINNVDSDGTQEYILAATTPIHKFTKIDNTQGWMGQGFTRLGAVVTAVVPD